MGEKKRATKQLLEQFPYCCLCGGTVKAQTREHVPPKALFDGSHRPNQLVVPACRDCNNGSKVSDSVAAIVARWGFDEGTDAERKDHRRLIQGISANHPEIIKEWLRNSGSVSQRQGKRHLKDFGVPIPDESRVTTIGPITLKYLNQFAIKLTLGIYFEQTRRCLPHTGLLRSFVRFKEDLCGAELPAELLDLLGEPKTLSQGAWNTREQFVFRVAHNPRNGLFMHASRLRTGLFLFGMASENSSILPEELITDWISPCSLLTILDDPRYEQKL